ncbi:MAG: HD domain-containing protein [Solirubrobacteraceae bacterium]
MSTASEDLCRQALRDACGEVEGPIERHSLRVFLLAEQLAGDRPFDRELLACASWLHDIGLYPPHSTREAYVVDGRRVAEELLAGWEPERLRQCADAVELHHEPRSQADKGLEVELLRLADRIEVSQGLLRAGLPRAVVRRIRREIPVKGFVPAVVRGLAKQRPASLPRIFFPR